MYLYGILGIVSGFIVGGVISILHNTFINYNDNDVDINTDLKKRLINMLNSNRFTHDEISRARCKYLDNVADKHGMKLLILSLIMESLPINNYDLNITDIIIEYTCYDEI